MYTTDKWTHNGSDNVKPLMISVLNKKKPEKKITNQERLRDRATENERNGKRFYRNGSEESTWPSISILVSFLVFFFLFLSFSIQDWFGIFSVHPVMYNSLWGPQTLRLSYFMIIILKIMFHKKEKKNGSFVNKESREKINNR